MQSSPSGEADGRFLNATHTANGTHGRPSAPRFQIIVPVYNEEDILETVLKHAKELDYLKNLIIVNDASIDGTQVILNRWARDESLNVLHLQTNQKKEGAVKALLETLRVNKTLRPYTVLLDADTYLESSSKMQTVNEKIEEAIEIIASGSKTALALRLNAVYRDRPSVFWMSAFTTYIGIQFDNWLLSKQRQLWVINGAAGLFKTCDLEQLFETMEFNFETGDLQITVDLMKQDKPIAFHKQIIANSYVPSTLGKFFNQRRRWERGTTKVLMQDRLFYASTLFPPSFLSLALIIHMSLYMSFWVALFAGIMDNYRWDWGLAIFVYSYFGWLAFDLSKGFWVIHKEKYRNFLTFFLCELVNAPITLFVIIPARLLGGTEGLLYLARKRLLSLKRRTAVSLEQHK
ncbi:MAG: glycosyltransferase family 2 protein [Acetobacteraceae bacterium]|nr:glycosyltransferase family 2 protein [Acetobacteraceae bacterium]